MIEQRGQADQIAIHPFEQPLESSIVQLQTATLRAQAQHVGTSIVVQRLQCDPCALRQPRAQIRQYEVKVVGHRTGCIQQAAPGIARAIVCVEERDLVFTVAGDDLKTIKSDHVGMFESIECVTQLSRSGGQRQIGRATPRSFGLGAGRKQEMTLAGRRGAGDINTASGVLTACQRTQLCQRAVGCGDKAVETLVGRKP